MKRETAEKIKAECLHAEECLRAILVSDADSPIVEDQRSFRDGVIDAYLGIGFFLLETIYVRFPEVAHYGDAYRPIPLSVKFLELAKKAE